jgi:membrane protease YdiL (CAAX protease family)
MITWLGRLRAVAWAALLALLVAGFASFIWGALLIANLKTTPAIPWSFGAMAVVLLLLGLYLNGSGWPARTSRARHAYLRARLVPGRVLAWALLAGGLALAGLVGLWIVLVELTHVGGNPTIASASSAPLLTLSLLLVMGSLVSSISEEFAFRGYAQVALERKLGAVTAVAISSLFFMFWHGPTQGFEWSKLLFYYLVGVVFGTTAFLTQSIVPAWPVHLAGDLLFFFLVWPRDAARRFVWRDGADLSFWLALAGLIVFTALAVLAFRRLALVARASAAPERALERGPHMASG